MSIPTDNPRCHVHQINGGEEQATVLGNTATIMFEGTGPAFPTADNLVTQFNVEIEQQLPNGAFMTRTVVDCATASQNPSPPFSVTCSVDPGEELNTVTSLSILHMGILYYVYGNHLRVVKPLPIRLNRSIFSLPCVTFCLLYVVTGHGQATVTGFDAVGTWAVQIDPKDNSGCIIFHSRRFSFNIQVI